MNSKRSRLLNSTEILSTGDAGFVGSHVERSGVKKYSQFHIFCPDDLALQGNLHYPAAVRETFNLPSIVTSCSGSYRPARSSEKLIPVFIHNINNRKGISSV